VFNDVAVAARAMQAEGLAQRILVVDLDVHQGDGTAAIFHGDDSVLTFSMHCEKNFPARKQQSDVDIGLAVGTGDAAYLECLQEQLARLIGDVRPDLAFYNAGVDPHADDRLGRLALSDAGLWARERLVLGRLRDAGVPVACVIGGGYADDIDALARRHAIVHRVAAEMIARR
jgi:acetoin utilization deacetylase AcuC-like enzyme